MDNTKQPLDKQDKPDDTEEQIVSLDESPVTPKRSQLPFAKRLTLGQRKFAWRLSIALCLLLLIILVVPNSLLSVGNVTTQLYDRIVPPPMPTLTPNLYSFYFDVNIPWTQVSIDGKAIHIPAIGSSSPIKLAIGKHIIRWQAPPFQAQSCIITIPVQFRLSDTCVLATSDLQQLPHPPQAQLLVLHESVNTLSADQQRALMSAVQNAFAQQNTSITVQPGEIYSNPNGNTANSTANQPLRATLRFQLDTSVDSPVTVGKKGLKAYTITARDCQILCSLPWHLRPTPSSHSQSPTWWAFVFAFMHWNYFTLDGHVIALDQPIDGGGASVSSHLVLLGLSWDANNWHINVFFRQDIAPFLFAGETYLNTGFPMYDDPACAAAQDLLLEIAVNSARVRYVSDTNPANGCLAIATSNSGSAPDLWYFEHFGTIYAVNAAARQLSPYFPQANTYQQRLTQQLSKLPGVVVNMG